MPAVQMFLRRLFERDVMIGEEPDLLIARGLGVYTGIKERKEEVKDILMTDVCPFSLGTSTAGNAPGDPERMCMMIERNSVLPCRRKLRPGCQSEDRGVKHSGRESAKGESPGPGGFYLQHQRDTGGFRNRLLHESFGENHRRKRL